MKSFCDFALNFNYEFQEYLVANPIPLPENYQIMNPFKSSATSQSVTSQSVASKIANDFYQKFYSDANKRIVILGINPGRNGAGKTGIPFTDTKHLLDLKLNAYGVDTREISAIFIYKLIAEFGGAKKFYDKFYINSPLPLGLLYKNAKNNLVNANYYDNKQLVQACTPAIFSCFNILSQMPINKKVCLCLGQGQNFKFIKGFNDQLNLFEKIIPIPHPRYIMQYKLKQLDSYLANISKELHKLRPLHKKHRTLS